MKISRILIFTVVVLLFATAVAAADAPELESFSTTGYTTNLIPTGDPALPLIPTEFSPVPSGHIKFHISAQGGPAMDDDQLCYGLYNDLFGGALPDPAQMPGACQTVCFAVTGQACGTTGFFDGGSFSFEEWGLYYPQSSFIPTPDGIIIGANYGDLYVTTGSDDAELRFSGLALADYVDPNVQTVLGSFISHDGSGAYKKIDASGTYNGDAGYIFTVNYEACEDDECPPRCAVFGGKHKVKKDKFEWEIENEGEDTLTVQKITINWPAENGQLEKVKLGGKTLNDQDIDPLWTTIDLSDWDGKEKDIQIKSGKKGKLKLEFETKYDAAVASDYTILVEFAEGCAVPFVAFGP